MSETANSEAIQESEKPVSTSDEVKFPPFPEPTDKDFDDVPEEERNYYKEKFPDLNHVKTLRLHCTSCDRHLGSAARNVARMRAHPMLRTLVCHTCHTFYNSGEFEKGDDGSELYCRWCGQGGQVYCCSNCPHVFCAKCIKRNFGAQKIKSIESTDDWRCFKCDPECLLYLRALCWAALRYCDLKNQIAYKTEDSNLREVYQKDCAKDYTECCKSKRRREKVEGAKKKESENKKNSNATSIISKIPSTIQVKKFASINQDDSVKCEKKATKRPASPKNTGIIIKNPISLAPAPRLLNPMSISPAIKKLKVSTPPTINTIRFVNDTRPTTTYSRIKPRAMLSPVPIISNFNGFNNSRNFNNVNMVVNDNINLSLDNLTQGLDMATMTAMSTDNNTQNDDVVCTPDFPIEPMCEVTEDNDDDDVQCITPDPVIVSYKNTNPPPLVPRGSALPELIPDNIIQMTENDVTVNLVTGGLKFRVDPQTLSSNKMYRLPDGRVFAIKSNPNMPGGYSATIVAVTKSDKTSAAKGMTFAAKLNAVSNTNTSTPITSKPREQNRVLNSKPNSTITKLKVVSEMDRECDLNVPVEWYRYNLIDAVDSLEYSLIRLNKLKKEATTMFLRTRNVSEMRSLHRTLDRLLNTSSKRFTEIRENLSKELKNYILKKQGEQVSDDDDDDDVEILPHLENDDPIFIDEHSVDSNTNDNISQEVDLTGVANSDNNDSGEKQDSLTLGPDPSPETAPINVNNSDELQVALSFINNSTSNELNYKKKCEENIHGEQSLSKPVEENECTNNDRSGNNDTNNDLMVCDDSVNEDVSDREPACDDKNSNNKEDLIDGGKEIEHKEECKNDNSDEKTVADSEMSNELIETLLKEESSENAVTASNSLDIPDLPAT